MKQLYFSFIHSYLSYGNIIWACVKKNALSKLFRKQKHALRIIFNKDRFSSSAPLFMAGKVLTIFQINTFQILCFVKNCLSGVAPGPFNTTFTRRVANRYNTRNCGTLRKPTLKSLNEQLYLEYRGAEIWNAYTRLYPELKQIECLQMFRIKAKRIIINEGNL